MSNLGSNSGSNLGSQSGSSQGYWRKCTTCKKLIQFGQKYWICSVSTCNRVRTDLVFCDLRCFDAHVPVLNHRDAGAFERFAPSEKSVALGSQPSVTPRSNSPMTPKPSVESDEILVVVSKVKGYIKSTAGMNTSDGVMDLLSRRIRVLADQAIQSALRNARKTVLDRDLS